MVLKNFIVLEGLDGAGTTTQAKLLHERHALQGIRAVLTQEPTSQPIGLAIRKILRKETPALPETLAYLFAADRNEHLHGPGGIRDLSAQGCRVISDRYLFSSLAYQSVGCGWDLVRELNRRFPLPEILIYLDIQPREGEKRLQSRQQREIFEFEDFQTKAAAGYGRVLREYAASAMRILSIDATRPPQAIHEEIWEFVKAGEVK
ncbi:MAG: dTMP kinase [Spirochaetia bacterium]|jgi:dTMP kinase|nr:dTMP kinase [Spirochaetia bacterium]